MSTWLTSPTIQTPSAVRSPNSRLPVIEDGIDDVLGVAQAKEILDVYVRGGAPDIRCHVRQAPVIRSPIHIALVHDEYSHFEGIVTNADLLESIVGALKKTKARSNRTSSRVTMARGSYPGGCRPTKWAAVLDRHTRAALVSYGGRLRIGACGPSADYRDIRNTGLAF
jgi:hypothetical protein